MTALSPVRCVERFGPIDPFKHAGIAGSMTYAAVAAVQALRIGDVDGALRTLHRQLEENDAAWADFLWPVVTPPALSEADMAQLVAEDEAADRREALWESCKELADRHGGQD